MFDSLITQAFLVIMVCSGIPLVVSSCAGLVVSVIQTATQIQDQTVTYVVKFASVCGTLALLAPWFCAELIRFMQEMLLRTSMLGRM